MKILFVILFLDTPSTGTVRVLYEYRYIVFSSVFLGIKLQIKFSLYKFTLKIHSKNCYGALQNLLLDSRIKIPSLNWILDRYRRSSMPRVIWLFARVSSWDDTSNLPCCGPSNSVSIYLQSVIRAVFYTYLTLFSHGTKKNKEKTCISKILV